MADSSTPIGSQMFSSIDKALSDIKQYSDNPGELSPSDLIKFNMAVSKFTMLTTMTSNMAKELADAEASIARNM